MVGPAATEDGNRWVCLPGLYLWIQIERGSKMLPVYQGKRARKQAA